MAPRSRDSGRGTRAGAAHRRRVPARRRRGHDPHGQLAERLDRDLSRTGEVEGDPVAHHGHHAVEQGDQRGSRHHRPDGGSRRLEHASADQGACARERHRIRGRLGYDDQDRRQPVLRETGRRATQHPHGSADELRPPRDQPADTRPAVLGEVGDARGTYQSAGGHVRAADRARRSGGGRRSPRDHHPQGLLARADRSRPGVQFVEHQGRAVRSRRRPAPPVGRGGASQRGHRFGPANPPCKGSAARCGAGDFRQAARAGADQGLERRVGVAGGSQAATSHGCPA